MKFSHTEDQAREIIQIYNNDHKGLREIFINDESYIVSDKEMVYRFMTWADRLNNEIIIPIEIDFEKEVSIIIEKHVFRKLLRKTQRSFKYYRVNK